MAAVSGPGKGADPAIWRLALQGVQEEKGAAWFVELAGRSKPARKAVAAAIDGSVMLDRLREQVGQPEASAERALRLARGREEEARRRTNPIARNEAFDCAHCGFAVPPAPGSAVRNHCPRCLHSLHVDGEVPGDRASACHGLMAPVDLSQRDGGFVLRQRCRTCGHERNNRLHPEWTVEPDRLAAFRPGEAAS